MMGDNKPQNSLKFTLWVFLLCGAMAGIQFVYSIQFAIGGPLLNQKYHLSTAIIPIILTTSGAISGFIVQPIVGVYSDNCASKFGRRRPFILGGLIFSIIGMFLVGNSVDIGNALGDKADGSQSGDHVIGLSIAITCLWVINISVNAMQGPARALIADLLPQESQQLGNAILTATLGFSNIIANVVGAQFLTVPDSYRIVFMIGCGFTTLCTLPTLIIAKEPYYEPLENESNSPLKVFAKIGTSFIAMPNVVVRIFIVFFLSWCAYSPFMVYLTLYFGYNVVNSGDDQDKFNHGVQLGMYGLAIFAGISFIYSLVQTPLLKVAGIRPTFFMTQILATVCYGALWFFSYNGSITIAIALVFTGLVGINFTANNSIPFALLADSVPNNKVGLYIGVLNSAATTSQVITNTLAGKVVVANLHDNVAWALALGAGISAGASLFIWILKTPNTSNRPNTNEYEPINA